MVLRTVRHVVRAPPRCETFARMGRGRALLGLLAGAGGGDVRNKTRLNREDLARYKAVPGLWMGRELTTQEVAGIALDALPALVAEIESLRAENERLRAES